MTSIDARTGLQRIDRDECFELLAGDVVGRLAVVHGHTPAIFPVNYVLDGADIVFRTDAGTKLDAAERASACFEIDGIDRKTRVGWERRSHRPPRRSHQIRLADASARPAAPRGTLGERCQGALDAPPPRPDHRTPRRTPAMTMTLQRRSPRRTLLSCSSWAIAPTS